MIEEMSNFLLDHLLEDADVFGLWNLDSEHLLPDPTENEAVEREELHGINWTTFKGISGDQKRKLLGRTRRFHQNV